MSVHEPNLELIGRLIAIDNVSAIGLGGSRASGVCDDASDFDLYAFTSGPVNLTARQAIADDLAEDGSEEIGNTWWGDEDGYAIDGTWYEIAYFDTNWFFGGIDAVVNQHRPSQGYSTSFVHTLAHLQPIHDPDGLIASWQSRISTYPDELAEAIIEANYPIVANAHASYRNQIHRAIELDDAVSVNHRVAGFLAVVFDIAFASLRIWHPGEKRQLHYLQRHEGRLPVGFTDHILEITANTVPDRAGQLMVAVDRVVADVNEITEVYRDQNADE